MNTNKTVRKGKEKALEKNIYIWKVNNVKENSFEVKIKV